MWYRPTRPLCLTLTHLPLTPLTCLLTYHSTCRWFEVQAEAEGGAGGGAGAAAAEPEPDEDEMEVEDDTGPAGAGSGAGAAAGVTPCCRYFTMSQVVCYTMSQVVDTLLSTPTSWLRCVALFVCPLCFTGCWRVGCCL